MADDLSDDTKRADGNLWSASYWRNFGDAIPYGSRDFIPASNEYKEPLSEGSIEQRTQDLAGQTGPACPTTQRTARELLELLREAHGQ